ncbi:MAG: YwmB family TATA-box binding protein [Bacillota bacterium]
MKNKLLFTFIMVLLLLCGLIFAAAAGSEAIENALGESLKATGAEVLESTISCWSRINREFLSAAQIEAEMDRLLLQINPDKESVSRFAENTDYINKEVVYASKENKSYAIAIESLKNEESCETYIIVDVYIDQSYEDLANEKEKIELMLKDKGELLKFNTCVIGTFDGKLTDKEMKSKIQKALRAVKARKVEGMETDDMNSISAFSSNIENSVESNEKKINMQIAMRYSSYDSKTYIWIGTPLIHVEY